MDLEAKTLSVVAQMNANDQFVAPKTAEAKRTLSIDEKTVDLLAKWRLEQQRQGATSADRVDDRDLVVTTSSGSCYDKNNYRRATHKLSGQIGLAFLLAPL